MKKKKSLIAIIAVLLIAVVGVTFAYFNSSAIFENQFNLGNYNIVTQEVFTSPSNWSPGDTTPKTITATNNGTINASVRVKIEEAWTDSNGDEISNIPNDAVTINFKNPSRWVYNSTDGYYYYSYYLKPGEATSTLTDSVTLNSNLNNSSCVEENGSKTCTSNVQGLAGATYTLTFTIETVQYDKYQEVWDTEQVIGEKPLVEIMTANRTKDTLQVGDEICVNGDTTECFNFIRYDGNNIKMLSKYNLKVGNIYDSAGTKTGEYSSSDTGYGLQSSEALGYVSGQNRYGTVAFSGTNYWYDGSTLKSKYGSAWDTNNIYDTDYSDASGTNYSVAYYVENYKDILENYGLTIQYARLLIYEEATDSNIGCNESSYSCPTTGFITNTSFWLGTAYSASDVWGVYADGLFFKGSPSGGSCEYFDGYYYGVRPVIVISKSAINS